VVVLCIFARRVQERVQQTFFGVGEDDGDDSKDDDDFDDDCDAARLEIVDHNIEIRKKSSSFVCSSGSFEPVEIENGRVRAEKQTPAERFDD